MSNFFDVISKPQKQLEYVKSNLDFLLCPSEFLEWLKKADEHNEGEYAEAVSSNCEYSCLWICGKLINKNLKGDMQVCYGKFGFWEHYWISYTLEGIEYYLDLTLAQFVNDAPRFAVTLAEDSQADTTYNDVYKTPMKEYFDSQKRDWDLIVSGEVLRMKESMSNINPFDDQVNKLAKSLDNLEL